MASEMVRIATDEKLKETDWAKNIEICELVMRDPGKAKDVIKSIKKRLGSKKPNTQLYSVMLVEMLMNNCGENIHKLVIDNGILPILVKIVKKKTDFPVRERIFLLLDATQTALGGAKGKFPQYYASYYELVAAGVEFQQHTSVTVQGLRAPIAQARSNKPTHETLSNKLNEPQNDTAVTQSVPDSNIIKKAASVLEVLRDVINSIDPNHPEGAMDEFVLDLVEQCSFQKQRVMHLVMTSRDEKLVTEAIELNEELHKVLVRHDSLLSVQPTSTTVASCITTTGEDQEEDAESLYRRIQKGKQIDSYEPIHSLLSIPEDKFRRPLTISSEPVTKPNPKPVNWSEPDPKPGSALSIPPPPSKHVERERFFREKNNSDYSSLPGHMRGLSINSRDGSSSCSGSTDFSD